MGRLVLGWLVVVGLLVGILVGAGSYTRGNSLTGLNSQFSKPTRAPDKIGNVNKSIPAVIKRAHENNGIIFNVR